VGGKGQRQAGGEGGVDDLVHGFLVREWIENAWMGSAAILAE
jgi:hypothetical protein